MRYVLKNWADEDTYYIQTNDPITEMLRKEDGKGFLESCGVGIIANLITTCGIVSDRELREPQPPYYWLPQPEATMMDYFHSPENYAKFKKIRPKLNPEKFWNNRVPQFYPIMLKDIFKIESKFEWKNIHSIKELIKKNIGIMVCLTNPGHYIGIVGYDDVTKQVCYRDPWPQNYWPAHLKGASGFNRWIDIALLQTNLESYRVLIIGKL